MKLQEEEEEAPFYGRTIGYCNRGPLFSRPAPYCHTAYCNAGQLITRIRPDEKEEKKLKKTK